MAPNLRRGPRPVDDGRDLGHALAGETAELGVLADGLGVLRAVHAVEAVARDVAVQPGVGLVEVGDRLVGRGGDAAEVRLGQLRGAGDLALDDEGPHECSLLVGCDAPRTYVRRGAPPSAVLPYFGGAGAVSRTRARP